MTPMQEFSKNQNPCPIPANPHRWYGPGSPQSVTAAVETESEAMSVGLGIDLLFGE